jgi:hypothetical protein
VNNYGDASMPLFDRYFLGVFIRCAARYRRVGPLYVVNPVTGVDQVVNENHRRRDVMVRSVEHTANYRTFALRSSTTSVMFKKMPSTLRAPGRIPTA